MSNGLGLSGGNASTGPHKINPLHNVMTRQRKRREHFKNSFKQLAKEFGGFTARGGHYWPEGMPRKIARQIAREKVA